MKNWQTLTAAAVMIVSHAQALASGIKIIANPSVTADTISVRELKSVFLGETNSLKGVHVEPVLEKRGEAHQTFLRQYLERSDDDLQKYYLALVFTGPRRDAQSRRHR